MSQAYTIIALCLVSLMASAQVRVSYQPADSVFVEAALAEASRGGVGESLPVFFARKFLSRPYVAHTLEADGEEHLVVNTRQLDCTTLVESVTALTICARRGERSFASYVDVLTDLRYRQGIVCGYQSRLHYFTEWIVDNEAMGLVKERQQPSPPFTATQTVKVGYMSSHPSAYRQLRGSSALIDTIAAMERRLSGMRFKYIPKKAVATTAALRQAIHDGDIIAIVSAKPGLDIAHLGVAVWQDDGLHMLHASMLHRKVVLDPLTLGQYLSRHASHTGIRVISIEQ